MNRKTRGQQKMSHRDNGVHHRPGDSPLPPITEQEAAYRQEETMKVHQRKVRSEIHEELRWWSFLIEEAEEYLMRVQDSGPIPGAMETSVAEAEEYLELIRSRKHGILGTILKGIFDEDQRANGAADEEEAVTA